VLVAAAVALALVFAPSTGVAEDVSDQTLVYPPFGHCLGLHRATTFHLFLYLGTRTVFNEPAGITAVKLAVNDDPETTSDDDELTVFGINSGESEIIYNTSLYNVEIFGGPGDGPGQFREPLGIAADESGNVYVADTGNDRIARLVYREAELEFVESYGGTGRGIGQFSRPSQVALGHSGTLYITDTGNDRVVVMSPSGDWLRELTGDAEAGVAFDRPSGLAAVEADDPWISARQDFLVVADRGGKRLVRLTLDGRVTAVAHADSLTEAGARFDYLAVDYYGSVYATDHEACRIRKLDRDLRYVTGIGRPGTDDMELDQPRGITIYRRFGQVFITERAGAQYFWIGTDILRPSAEPATIRAGRDETVVRYFLTEVARVDLELYDSGGRRVHTLVANRRRAIGDNTERWNGTSGRSAEPLPPGSYVLRLTARPTYSAGDYFQDTVELPIQLR
jgi:sugar lactone lactonase YvrE